MLGFPTAPYCGFEEVRNKAINFYGEEWFASTPSGCEMSCLSLGNCKAYIFWDFNNNNCELYYNADRDSSPLITESQATLYWRNQECGNVQIIIKYKKYDIYESRRMTMEKFGVKPIYV